MKALITSRVDTELLNTWKVFLWETMNFLTYLCILESNKYSLWVKTSFLLLTFGFEQFQKLQGYWKSSRRNMVFSQILTVLYHLFACLGGFGLVWSCFVLFCLLLLTLLKIQKFLLNCICIKVDISKYKLLCDEPSDIFKGCLVSLVQC